jgi:acyl-CoA thioester hydrolase
MSEVYRYDFTVPADAEDENGHVNNVEYLRWMQDAAMLHSESQGCTQATKAVGATWVVRTHRIKYLRPAFAGEQVSVLTWVSNLRRVQSLRKYKVIRTQDNALLAEGETDWVFVEAGSGKLRSIPKNIQALFETVPEEIEPGNHGNLYKANRTVE